MMGLLVPLLGAGLILGLLGGAYSCVYNRGAEDAEAANLRATIQAGQEAQKGTTAAYARVSDDLAGEREKTAALTAEIDRLSLAPPPQSEGTVSQEDGVCHWDDSLPWPPSDG